MFESQGVGDLVEEFAFLGWVRGVVCHVDFVIVGGYNFIKCYLATGEVGFLLV